MEARVSRRGFLSLVPLCVALMACKREGGSASDKPKVAVSIFPLYDVARRVAGDRLDVALVLPAGRSEHSFDPTPGEMARVAKARLGVSVGLGMDGWLEKIIQGAAGKEVPIVQLGPKASPRRMKAEEVGASAAEEAAAKKGEGDGHDHDHDHDDHDDHDHAEHGHAPGAEDPHFWLDPVRMLGATDALVEAFTKLDIGGAEGFRARGDEVKKSLGELHKGLEARSRAWTKRTIVTFHGSMGYFADRYGLTIAAVIEPFPGKEPTARYLKEVIGAIERSKASALFSEPQLDKRPAQVIADQAKVPLFELDPIGGGPGADTYEKLLLKNADVLDKALA
jgi:zinc transport system substrate-binding protein